MKTYVPVSQNTQYNSNETPDMLLWKHKKITDIFLIFKVTTYPKFSVQLLKASLAVWSD